MRGLRIKGIAQLAPSITESGLGIDGALKDGPGTDLTDRPYAQAFKDWNDCLLNKPITPVLAPRKEERDQNLAERRKGSLKM